MLDFSVVINTRDHPAELGQCLDALQRQTLDPARWEIVIVDDGSRDGATAQAAGRYAGRSECRFVRIAPSGCSAARNAGIEAARGRLVLFLGDDVRVEPDLLAEHLEAHKGRPRAAILGHREEKTAVASPIVRKYWDNLRFQDIRDPENASFAFFYTCNVSVERRLLLEAGGFDENFTFPAWEDLDMGLRLEKIGVRIVYYPRARASHHHPNPTLESLCRREYGIAFSAWYFFHKWPAEPEVQKIPYWNHAQTLGTPGPLWRKAAGRKIIGFLETLCPVPALLEPLCNRLIGSCRAEGLRDGKAHYEPLLERWRSGDIPETARGRRFQQ